MNDPTPRAWATVWYDPDDSYRKHTLVLLDEGIELEIGAPLIDAGATSLTSLKHAQGWLVYQREMVRNGQATVTAFREVGSP